MKTQYFYCYSYKMNMFLMSLGEKYITKAINPNTNKNYWMYQKSKRLDFLIQQWNTLKV